MYWYGDCSLRRPKRGVQEAFSQCWPSAGLSASFALRRAFSQFSAMAPRTWRGTDSNEAPPMNFQVPTNVRLPLDEACQTKKGR